MSIIFENIKLDPYFTPWKVKVAQLCPILCNPVDYRVHGILQARILQWVAFPFSRGSSPPRDWTQVSHIIGTFSTSWATRGMKNTLFLFLKKIFICLLGLNCVTSELSLWCTDSLVVAHGLSCPRTRGNLVPWPGMDSVIPALQKQVLNHLLCLVIFVVGTVGDVWHWGKSWILIYDLGVHQMRNPVARPGSIFFLRSREYIWAQFWDCKYISHLINSFSYLFLTY